MKVIPSFDGIRSDWYSSNPIAQLWFCVVHSLFPHSEDSARRSAAFGVLLEKCLGNTQQSSHISRLLEGAEIQEFIDLGWDYPLSDAEWKAATNNSIHAAAVLGVQLMDRYKLSSSTNLETAIGAVASRFSARPANVLDSWMSHKGASHLLLALMQRNLLPGLTHADEDIPSTLRLGEYLRQLAVSNEFLDPAETWGLTNVRPLFEVSLDMAFINLEALQLPEPQEDFPDSEPSELKIIQIDSIVKSMLDCVENLSMTKRNILVLLLEEAATDSDRRMNAESICSFLGGELGLDSGSIKPVLAELKHHGFLQSIVGRGGGYFLTSKGSERAARIPSQQPARKSNDSKE